MTKTTTQRPLRAGVFADVTAAETAVSNLLAAGFTKDEITVVCSDAAVERHFKAFHKQDPAGTHTPAAALGGGVIGAALGGLAAVAGGIATGGIGSIGHCRNCHLGRRNRRRAGRRDDEPRL